MLCGAAPAMSCEGEKEGLGCEADGAPLPVGLGGGGGLDDGVRWRVDDLGVVIYLQGRGSVIFD